MMSGEKVSGANAPGGPQEIILRAKSVGGILSEKGRIPVLLFDGKETKKYSIEAERISEVYVDANGIFYIKYSTTHPEYYAQYTVASIPEISAEVELEEKEITVGDTCDCGIYWDPDVIEEHIMADGFCECPECGKTLEIRTERKVVAKYDKWDLGRKLLKKFVEQHGFKLGPLVTCAEYCEAGGEHLYTLTLYESEEHGWHMEIGKGLEKEESHYDDIEKIKHIDEKEGFFAILEIPGQKEAYRLSPTSNVDEQILSLPPRRKAEILLEGGEMAKLLNPEEVVQQLIDEKDFHTAVAVAKKFLPEKVKEILMTEGEYYVQQAKEYLAGGKGTGNVLWSIDKSIIPELEKKLGVNIEEMKKLVEKEWRRRAEEERKEKIQKKISEVISKLPDWADGAIAISIVSWGEGDADAWIEFVPIKKSKFADNQYYYGSWAHIASADPDFPEVIILKNGTMKKYKKVKDNEKYTTVEVVE